MYHRHHLLSYKYIYTQVIVLPQAPILLIQWKWATTVWIPNMNIFWFSLSRKKSESCPRHRKSSPHHRHRHNIFLYAGVWHSTPPPSRLLPLYHCVYLVNEEKLCNVWPYAPQHSPKHILVSGEQYDHYFWLRKRKSCRCLHSTLALQAVNISILSNPCNIKPYFLLLWQTHTKKEIIKPR